MAGDQDKDKRIPPAVHSDDPEAELEEELRKHPDDLGARADVGSDESMDASDPPSATRRSCDEPAPSSSFPED